jgi:hypothetical protein
MSILPKNISTKVKIHTVYKLASGEKVPGATTVLGEIAKPALIHWAWKLGIEGKDYKVFRDELAEVGTLAHKMILAHLKDETLCQDDYTANQIGLAENCFLKYLEWERQHKIEPISVEEPMVSETWRYGGTADFFGNIDGLLTVMDFKTGKGIYEDYWYQLAAYGELIREVTNVSNIHSYRILNIGRDETENFIEEQRGQLVKEFDIFTAALKIYQLKKEVKRGVTYA